MKLKLILCFLFLHILYFNGHAQETAAVKFGNVSEKDFARKVYSIDSNASAVIIADIGSSKIEGNNKSSFSLIYKRYRRVHILNKNGYDLADVSIPLYSDGEDEEELDKFRAVTYNLEGGKVVETRLDVKNNLFKDKINKNIVVKKFTLANVKEGSILEYEYTIKSDFLYNLQPWEFQGGYPRLWSEYNLALPGFFNYVFLTQGYRPYDIREKKEHREIFKVINSSGTGGSEAYTFTAGVSDYRWVIKNVPALKEENFTSTLDNHISKIGFQLSERLEPLAYHEYMDTWDQLAKTLMEAEYFGLPLSKDNGWLKDIIDPLVKETPSALEKAQKIFAFTRDNFTCTNYSSRELDQSLRNVVKNHSGNVAEINLLLTAMLKYADITADPVILSTRANGYAYSMYPLINQYNYVIARTGIDGKYYYLDASEPRLGFGYLPLRCYNGHGRVINEAADSVELSSDSVKETEVTSMFIINDGRGNLAGSMQQAPGYYESCELRNRIAEKGEKQLQKDIGKEFGAEISISNFHIDSLDKYESGLGIKYDFNIKGEKEDIMYLNPMFGKGYKDNPFKSAERLYPVEMPYTMDQTYTLQLEVPAGYVVDEVPKSMFVKLNEQEEGIFEYRISYSGGNISFRSRIRLNRSYFLPDEYEMLREFFNLVVKKQSEQIVFKKKK